MSEGQESKNTANVPEIPDESTEKKPDNMLVRLRAFFKSGFSSFKDNPKGLLENKTFLKIISLCLAFLCWILVALTVSSTTTLPISNVKVDFEQQISTLTSMGLNIIDISTHEVTAEVYGERGIVGRLQPEDLTATIKISYDGNKPGTYDAELVPVNADNSYEIVKYSPSTIKVKVDVMESKTFTVEAVINGISLPPEYIRDMQNSSETVTPSQVVVTGPQVELDKIERCIVQVELEAPLEGTYANEFPIILQDAQGNTIDAESKYLTMDYAEAQVVIPVLKKKTLSLIFDYINADNFNTDNLIYAMSRYEVEIAGPVEQVDRYQEILLGSIDMRELSINRNSYTFNVDMPSPRFSNLDHVYEVTVTFDSQTWDEAVFTVSDIKERNVPEGYEIAILSQLDSITFCGEESVVRSLAAGDIIAEIDFSGKEITAGQYNYPVQVTVPQKENVWAVGEHNVLIQVTERPPEEGQ